MTTEDDFQRQLNREPADSATRLVFADWLQERGDPRAEGYRALGVLRKYPAFIRFDRRGRNWYWCRRDPGDGSPTHNDLPDDWFQKLDGPKGPTFYPRSCPCNSRRKMDDAAALAFAQLPLERRAELLAGKLNGEGVPA